MIIDSYEQTTQGKELRNMQSTAFTVEQADQVVARLGYTEQVEDYEYNEHGHIYTLFDGSALVVRSENDYSLTKE
jgi:hypothetical protein